MTENGVSLAAQADLVLLTVDMLRPPITDGDPSNDLPWYALPNVEFDNVLQAAFGADADKTIVSSEDLSPRSALNETLRCARAFDLNDWSGEYCRLFNGAVACPLNQASYVRRDKGKILGDVSAFYHAFGFRDDPDSGERPDHLLCQLEFVAMALALASNATEHTQKELVADALSLFAKEHMHDWLPAVCWQLCEEAQFEYFGAVSNWVIVFWQSLTDRHGWPVDELPDRRMKPIVDPDDPYECGAPDLHQIQSR